MHREHAIQYLVSRLDEYSYVTTLVALVPQLPASMIGRVFEKTVALEREGDQARLLVALSPRLSDEHMVEAFVTALKLPADQRPQVLGSLLEHMTASVLERVLHEIAMLSPGSVRQEALTVLAPQLNGKLLEQALIIAGTLGGAENTDWILHDLARLLAPPLPKEALATASRIQDETLRSDTLLMLGVYVTGEERHKALELALSSEPGEYRMMHRVETLTEVAHHLVGEDKKRVVEQALNFIRDRISDKLSQAELFAGLMAYLTDTEQITVLEQVLNILDSLTDEEARADTLIELLPYMPDQQQAWAVEQALKTVKGTSADLLQIERANRLLARSETWNRPPSADLSQVKRLIALLPYVADERRAWVLDQILAAALDLQDEQRAALRPYLTDVMLEHVLSAMLSCINTIEGIVPLIDWIPYLPESHIERTYEAALTIEETESGTAILAALAPRLQSSQQRHALEKVLDYVLALSTEPFDEEVIGDDEISPQNTAVDVFEDDILKVMASSWRGELLEDALMRMLSVRRSQILALNLIVEVIHYIGEHLSQSASEVAENAPSLMKALSSRLPQLSNAVLERLYAATTELPSDELKMLFLQGLAPILKGHLLDKALNEVLHLQATETAEDTVYVYAELYPDNKQLTRHCSILLYNNLLSMKSGYRTQLLYTLHAQRLRYLNSATIAAITHHVIEICQEWRWI